MKRIICLFCSMVLNVAIIPNAYSQCGYPLDDKHRAIASPAGNLSYVSLPNSICAPTGEYTWSFLGSVKNADDNGESERHSLEIVLMQLAKIEESRLGINSLSFSFRDAGDLYRVDSTYGGEDAVATAIEHGVSNIDLQHGLKGISLISQAKNIAGTYHTKWTINSSTPEHSSSPLFTGYLGQPGHIFDITGEGNTFIWQIKDDGNQAIQQYKYFIKVNLVDERGVVGEGFGGSYIGPDIKTGVEQESAISEYEIGLPRLKVVQWQIELTALNNKLPAGFKSQYHYSGSEGMMWADFGPVIPGINKQPSLTSKNNLLNELLILKPGLVDFLPTKQKPLLQKAAIQSENSSSNLYNGNWIYTQFTKGIYKGAAVLAVPFWNKTENRPIDQNTDQAEWASAGFINVFTGLNQDDPAAAYTVNDVLVKGNPEVTATPPLNWTRPFTIKLIDFADAEKFNLVFPWATEVEFVIKGNTQARFALAAYAMRQNPEIKDDPSKPIIINIKAVNPVNEHILFSKSVTQYSEAAAVSRVDGEVIGNGWIEHMVKLQ